MFIIANNADRAEAQIVFTDRIGEAKHQTEMAVNNAAAGNLDDAADNLAAADEAIAEAHELIDASGNEDERIANAAAYTDALTAWDEAGEAYDAAEAAV